MEARSPQHRASTRGQSVSGRHMAPIPAPLVGVPSTQALPNCAPATCNRPLAFGPVGQQGSSSSGLAFACTSFACTFDLFVARARIADFAYRGPREPCPRLLSVTPHGEESQHTLNDRSLVSGIPCSMRPRVCGVRVPAIISVAVRRRASRASPIASTLQVRAIGHAPSLLRPGRQRTPRTLLACKAEACGRLSHTGTGVARAEERTRCRLLNPKRRCRQSKTSTSRTARRTSRLQPRGYGAAVRFRRGDRLDQRVDTTRSPRRHEPRPCCRSRQETTPHRPSS